MIGRFPCGARLRGAAIGLAAVLAAFACAADAHGEDLSRAEYRDRLARIAAAWDAGDDAAVAEAARALRSARVVEDGEAVTPDPGLLEPLADAPPAERAALRGRLATLLAALDADLAADPSSEAPTPDRDLLRRIRHEQEVAEAEAGGDVPSLPEPNRSVLEWIRDVAKKLWEWLAERLESLLRWLLSFAPRRVGEAQTGSLTVALLVGIVLVVALMVVGTLYALRRGRTRSGPLATGTAAAPAPAEDADPLSRSANDWESYAARLAGEGRLREAIRAWYHAVLVTLFSAGLLHYRKGATNWEYVAAVSADAAWRRSFEQATRGFERAWYGHGADVEELHPIVARDARGILAAVRQGGPA